LFILFSPVIKTIFSSRNPRRFAGRSAARTRQGRGLSAFIADPLRGAPLETPSLKGAGEVGKKWEKKNEFG
jgi:hypothetical protein